jgi:hypothetical protein
LSRLKDLRNGYGLLRFLNQDPHDTWKSRLQKILRGTSLVDRHADGLAIFTTCSNNYVSMASVLLRQRQAFPSECQFEVPEGLILVPKVIDRDVPRAIADLRGGIQGLQTDFTTAEEYAAALEGTIEALAAENRRLGHQYVRLASQNRRLRGAEEQMRAELLVLNKLLEQFPANQLATEHQEYQQQLAGLTNQLVRCAKIVR